MNGMQKAWSTGFICMLSCICSICYNEGKREAFLGLDPKGGTVLGIRPQDREFQNRIWKEFKRHMKTHGREVYKSGPAWSVRRISESA